MKLKSKDIAQKADDEIIANAKYFVVNWFIGRTPETYRTLQVRRDSLFIRKEFNTLGEARTAQKEAGRDQYGRTGMIYAVGDRDISVFVDPEYEKRRVEL